MWAKSSTALESLECHRHVCPTTWPHNIIQHPLPFSLATSWWSSWLVARSSSWATLAALAEERWVRCWVDVWLVIRMLNFRRPALAQDFPDLHGFCDPSRNCWFPATTCNNHVINSSGSFVRIFGTRRFFLRIVLCLCRPQARRCHQPWLHGSWACCPGHRSQLISLHSLTSDMTDGVSSSVKHEPLSRTCPEWIPSTCWGGGAWGRLLLWSEYPPWNFL